MAEPFLPDGVGRPDFYLAAMGRSGSTMICNWLTDPPEQLVFSEPFFLQPRNPRLLRIQLADFGMGVPDKEWETEDTCARARFKRLMAPRLRRVRWGVKEVLASEHGRCIEHLMPRRVLISVRHIGDVALSFFEKHRAQGNLDRFSDDWVLSYCLREAKALVELHGRLRDGAVPHRVIRYEDFIGSDVSRKGLVDFLGWRGGGSTDRHLGKFDRIFEVERHGRSIGSRCRRRSERDLDATQLAAATFIEENCSEYQQAFGYS